MTCAASRPDQSGPSSTSRKRRRQEFGISEDGRLIIDTGDDDDPARSSDDDEGTNDSQGSGRLQVIGGNVPINIEVHTAKIASQWFRFSHGLLI